MNGNGTTLQGAIDAVTANNTTPFLIYVKNGTYSEVVTVASGKNHVHLIGQSRDGVVIQYTVDPSVLTINATDFYAENITLNNT
jgi:pectin methylesterase-like acyl-CoA thioesterase